MIGNNIKWIREELEMTQKELGNIFGVSDSTVRGWENAYDTMPLKKMIKLCNMYGYSMDFVLGFTRKNHEYNNKIKLNKHEIGKKLKELRENLGVTQQEIANTLSISRSTYSHYETGIDIINSLTLYTICKTYHVSSDYIVGRTNQIKIE